MNATNIRISCCLLLLALIPLINPTAPRAQFDPNCYHPALGAPGEVDTIYGSYDKQELTNSLNVGPAPGESYGRVLMYGLPQNIPFLSAVSTGPSFDLHHLNVTGVTKFNLSRLHYRLGQTTSVLHLSYL